MKQSEEIKAAIDVLLGKGMQDELQSLLTEIISLTLEPGINQYDIREQLYLALGQVEIYCPELEKLLCKCKDLKQ